MVEEELLGRFLWLGIGCIQEAVEHLKHPRGSPRGRDHLADGGFP